MNYFNTTLNIFLLLLLYELLQLTIPQLFFDFIDTVCITPNYNKILTFNKLTLTTTPIAPGNNIIFSLCVPILLMLF